MRLIFSKLGLENAHAESAYFSRHDTRQYTCVVYFRLGRPDEIVGCDLASSRTEIETKKSLLVRPLTAHYVRLLSALPNSPFSDDVQTEVAVGTRHHHPCAR